jgi:hypothetical protein
VAKGTISGRLDHSPKRCNRFYSQWKSSAIIQTRANDNLLPFKQSEGDYTLLLQMSMFPHYPTNAKLEFAPFPLRDRLPALCLFCPAGARIEPSLIKSVSRETRFVKSKLEGYRRF